MRRWKHPENYMGAAWPDYFVFLGQHRDSDSVDRSNFRVGLLALADLPEPPEGVESRFVVRESHWAVGWVEWIAVHESDVAAIEACDRMLKRIENYPVLDEFDLSEMEWSEAVAWWERAGVRERLDVLRSSRSNASAFSVRRDELPQDDGQVLDYLRSA